MELQRILYVEDDADIRAIAVMVLESINGFTLEVCASGAEALEKGQAFKPDLALLDVMMPGMDGPQTMNGLHQLIGLESLPIVFMTAKVQPQEVKNYLNLGAIGVIAKPFDPMTLAEQLHEIWRGRHAING